MKAGRYSALETEEAREIGEEPMRFVTLNFSPLHGCAVKHWDTDHQLKSSGMKRAHNHLIPPSCRRPFPLHLEKCSCLTRSVDRMKKILRQMSSCKSE